MTAVIVSVTAHEPPSWPSEEPAFEPLHIKGTGRLTRLRCAKVQGGIWLEMLPAARSTQ